MSIEQTGKLTYADYLLMPNDGCRHEVIDGRHRMNPAPLPGHQTASRMIQYQLMTQIEIPGFGQVFNAPVDLQLGEHDIVQPDLVMVLAGNWIIKPNRIHGVPDLIVEIVSPSTQHLDRGAKKRLYQRVRVPEYWIVDPAGRNVERFRWTDGAYEETVETLRIEYGGVAQASVVVDLELVWRSV